jgi:hypothetical protein
VLGLAPEAPGDTPDAFLAKLTQGGGIVEQWITGRELRSPSVQLQTTPLGEVQLVSTHDQILGGANGQTYLGCAFRQRRRTRLQSARSPAGSENASPPPA